MEGKTIKKERSAINLLVTDEDTGAVLGHYRIDKNNGIHLIVQYDYLSQLFEIILNHFKSFRDFRRMFTYYQIEGKMEIGEGTDQSK